MKRIVGLLMALLCFAFLPGCTQLLNYPKYIAAAKESIEAGEETKQKGFEALGKAVEHGDDRTRTAATVGILLLLDRHKNTLPEAPKESSIERGLGGVLESLPGVGQILAIGELVDKTKGSNTYNQSVSGQGAGGSIATGSGPASASPATSPPTVVNQPPPVVVGGE